ncbi:hypothetical protein DDE82_000400 [Stemphylium lycopersici]|uniref:1-alkyl-2-acetylglycerophosphocholine esterase n=1 Tax=Stemphylium lycopersici TaxID=183478 RepID=A0A364NBA3_STELY|nr:hypothetical protein TW65_08831 [Stemphylium lycopersici]RAR12060.1 hypothetical protein DDE82_000400 [Stemphylium lycopersici]RAR14487.1 hypothetical protein DDE83_002059 [Stemphylium lycopersici]
MGSLIGLTLIIVLALGFSGSSNAIQIPGADDNHKYKVAVTHFPLTDTAHKDPYHPTEDRRVMVSLFMPIPKNSCSLECETTYMPPQTAKIANEQFVVGGKRDAGVFEEMSYKVCCRSTDKIDASKIPVVVLEPHVDTSRLLYSTMARFISANGAVVVMIDHPGDTSIVEFTSSRKRGLDTVYNSGTVPLSNMSPLTNWNSTVETAITTRKSDISFTLSQINTSAFLQRQFPSFSFTSALNTNTYGIIGHGLGGSVATSLGTSSSAATVFSINLSGTPPLLASDVRNSPLFFFGREDFRRENDIHWPTTWSHLTGHATEFDLDDSAIFDVSDLPKIIELARNEGGKEGVAGKGLSGYAPVQGAQAITCFVENIVKMQFRLEGQGQDLSGCVRIFGGVVPYPGH